MYDIKTAISDIYVICFDVDTVPVFLGIFLTESKRKNYYQASRCKKFHLIIFIHKRVILIIIGTNKL